MKRGSTKIIRWYPKNTFLRSWFLGNFVQIIEYVNLFQPVLSMDMALIDKYGVFKRGVLAIKEF